MEVTLDFLVGSSVITGTLHVKEGGRGVRVREMTVRETPPVLAGFKGEGGHEPGVHAAPRHW